MSRVSKETVLSTLQQVFDPETGQDILAAGLVTGLFVGEDSAGFVLEVTPERGQGAESLRQAAENMLLSIPGINRASVILTAHRVPAHPVKKKAVPGEKIATPQIARIIVVASGKGGVGKSTTAVNLAVALQQSGLRVGLLDADIYGPSLPRMLGTNQRPEQDDNGKIVPVAAFGLSCMSIGFMLDTEKPLIWRGPMVMGAIEQMMRDVAWPELDVLVVDMPPGTGDAQLTMAQRVNVSGAVIVSTPQDIALVDARKGLAMFQKTGVAILGIVENMSVFCCPACGHQTAIFGQGGAEAEAGRLGVPFLGAVPLHPVIRTASDAGQPVALDPAQANLAAVYQAMAVQVREKLGLPSSARHSGLAASAVAGQPG